MARNFEPLVVALGERRYRIERPWGELPAGSGKVTAVTVDSAGTVYVLTRGDHYLDNPRDCIHALTADGAHRRSFGDGRIADPHMIACDAQDRLWVVDRDAHEIVAFTREGRECARLGTRHGPLEPFNHPTDIAFTADGGCVVSDGYAGARIHRFDRDLKPVASWGEVGVGPGQFLTVHSLWALDDGRIVVADRENHRLQVFHPDGTLDAVWPGYHRPSDLWGDTDGTLYVSDGVPTLTRLDPQGNRLGRCRPVLNAAHGLWGDLAGRIYLAEGAPSRVTRLVPM